MEVNIVNSQAS